MWGELQILVDELGLSHGQLLLIAREVSGNLNLRTIDRLTASERCMLMAELQKQMALVYAV